MISPDGKFVLAACGGYNHTGLAVLSLAEKRVTRFFPLPEVFNGLAFSNDGKPGIRLRRRLGSAACLQVREGGIDRR